MECMVSHEGIPCQEENEASPKIVLSDLGRATLRRFGLILGRMNARFLRPTGRLGRDSLFDPFRRIRPSGISFQHVEKQIGRNSETMR